MPGASSSSDPRVVLRPVGSAAPLGLFGLAAASLVFAGLQLGWASTAEGTVVGALVLAVAVPLQSASCLVALAARDGALGTTMGFQAAMWAAIGVAEILLPPGGTADALGLLLLTAGALLAASAFASGVGRVVVGLTVALLGARFALSGLYELLGSSAVEHAAGIVGLVVTASAAYAGLALQLEDARGRPVLPARGSAPATPSPAEQAAELEREPGVRPHL